MKGNDLSWNFSHETPLNCNLTPVLAFISETTPLNAFLFLHGLCKTVSKNGCYHWSWLACKLLTFPCFFLTMRIESNSEFNFLSGQQARIFEDIIWVWNA
jgi:hypothetical protein